MLAGLLTVASNVGMEWETSSGPAQHEEVPVPSTTVSRQIAADPTSVALLLADPTSAELWPRLSRREPAGAAGDVVDIAVGGTEAELRVLPPRRTPTAFVLRFDVDTAEALHVEGRLELSPTDAQPVATQAVLELRCERELVADAEEFLRRVARAAERRAGVA